MRPTNVVIRAIRKGHKEGLDVAEIALRAGIRYEQARQIFEIVTGESLKDYKKRRQKEADEAILVKVIDQLSLYPELTASKLSNKLKITETRMLGAIYRQDMNMKDLREYMKFGHIYTKQVLERQRGA